MRGDAAVAGAAVAGAAVARAAVRPLADVTEIRFPPAVHAALVDHGRRKLAGRWEPGEEPAPKAYGLVAGRMTGPRMEVTHVIPLRRNVRDRADLKPHLDRIMHAVAVPSETPMERRGWVADPLEVMAAERRCDEAGAVLFGAYHMHRVAWPHDPWRDSCTAVDRCLARESGLWALILSLVDPARPRVRAFYEGDNLREALVRVEDAHRC